MLRWIIYPILMFAILVTVYAKGYNTGFDSGYDLAVAEVLLGEVNPQTYFKKYLKKNIP